MIPVKVTAGPRLLLQSGSERSTIFRLGLTTAYAKVLVRLTGGCGYMSSADAQGLYDLFVPAFDGFSGALLYGGTRIVSAENPSEILPSITELGPLIRRRCPAAKVHGVIPRTDAFSIDSIGRLIISHDSGNGLVSIVHPDQESVLMVQHSVDEAATWGDEWKVCAELAHDLKAFGGFQPLVIAYNGGRYTAEEIEASARSGTPTLLIAGSGRKTDEYASNGAFLSAHPSVRVIDRSPQALRLALEELGIVPKFARRSA